MKVILATELKPADSERLRRAFPEVEFLEAYNEEAIQSVVTDGEAIFGGHITAGLLDRAGKLKWIQTRSAGTNHLPVAAIMARNILLTNASGAHGVPIAENILALMLAFATRLPALLRAQQESLWSPERVWKEKFNLEGQTLLVIGLGDLGATLARKAVALGMRVIGVRNRPLPPPPGVEKLYTRELLPEALAEADHVALCLPLTDETTAYIGEAELRQMKPTAYLYNAGRGQSIAAEPLIRALKEGWIAGAGLDVTDPEPLPKDHPLWSLPNVILTQHTSGASPFNSRWVTDIFIENLRHYLNGEPLKNRVDPLRGY
jgi:phosphoglycerate dehydrogenase-like enzyme